MRPPNDAQIYPIFSESLRTTRTMYVALDRGLESISPSSMNDLRRARGYDALENERYYSQTAACQKGLDMSLPLLLYPVP